MKAARAGVSDAIARAHLVPIRHHSPRSTAVALEVLAKVEPELVLVEGPEDAAPLLEVLVDDATHPPVAILGYRADQKPGSILWPFASYSPEYAALRWAKRHGAASAFIDIPIGRSLAEKAGPSGASRGDDAGEDDLDVHETAAARAGFRSFEELWEARFEAPAYDPASFRAAIVAYADLARAAERDEMDRMRDAFMVRRIEEHAERVDPARIVVVAGAAHIAAWIAGDVERGLDKKLPKPVVCESTVIPFSFPRLGAQLGYGAGNRAPMYYQRAFDAGGSFARATLETLLDFAQHLRLRGFSASLADAIDGYRLALTLASMRDKAAPGLDELRDAAIATLCRGDATHVDGFLWPSVVGKNVGRVAARIGKNSLEEEFWRTVREKKLPMSDALESFSLRLSNAVEVETSVFLHRLRVVGVPYASYAGADPRKGDAASAGGYGALARAREAWEAQWTPATDVALVEAIVYGDSLEQVAARVLERRLASAGTTAEAAEVLLEAVVTSCASAAGEALATCERLAAIDDDLPSLAGAARALATLVSLGTSRARTRGGDAAVTVLFQKVFERAVLRAEVAASVSDDAVGAVNGALRLLHDLALGQPTADRAAWIVAARKIAASDAVHPAAAGHAEGLLYLAQERSDADVELSVVQRLANALEPRPAARWLEGFLEVNALAIVKSRPVVAALDGYLVGIDSARFRDVLPVLRRAFAHLGATERRHLLENLLTLRAGDAATSAEAAKRMQNDREALEAMQGELARAMNELDDLL